MVTVYRILFAPDALTLRVPEDFPFGAQFAHFDGARKEPLSPKAAFRLEAIDKLDQTRVFCRLTPGVLLIPEAALEECGTLYYALCAGTEQIAMQAGRFAFRGINPLEVLPPDPSGAPCRIDRYYSAVFRMQGQPASDLFCVEGIAVPGDEFKYGYDTFGFSGLLFEPVWNSQTGFSP
jgi:hypothetical protein